MKNSKLLVILIVLFLSGFFAATPAYSQAGWLWGKGSTQSDTNSLFVKTCSAIDTAGNVITCGFYGGGDSVSFNGTTLHFPPSHYPACNYYSLIIKTDASGHVQWVIQSDSTYLPTTELWGITADDTGNIYVSGRCDTTLRFGAVTLTSTSHGNGLLMKISPSGSIVWWRTFANCATTQKCLKIDKSNNLYLAGYYFDTTTFSIDGVSLPGCHTDAPFLGKFTAGGALIWLKNMNNCISSSPNLLTTCGDGTSYLQCVYIPPYWDTSLWYIHVGAFTLHAHHVPSFVFNNYLAKIDSSGHIAWAISPNDSVSMQGIIADKNNNVYLTGRFDSTATFGSTTLTGYGHSGDMFLSKYDSTGHFVWAKMAGGIGADNYLEGQTHLNIDKCGSLWVSGTMGVYDTTQTMNFSGTILPLSSDFPAYIARYDVAGNFLSVTATHAGNSLDLLPDERGNLYLTGIYGSSSIFLGADTLHATINNSQHLFIAKYNYSNEMCNLDSTITQVIPVTVSKGFNIYPNPVQNDLVITGQDRITDVIIVNLLGQIVYQNKFDSQQVHISVSGLTNGIYLIKINGLEVSKFLKE